ncbi:hypothetical protein [Varibaculum prostatecancerukia]|uniref:hypothetical protein n=1 Tax=Varibaculum prostatecancerukia TaxID=2811781 RepID=UPI001C00180A|nr:hypothetical protein [Varibaculum prostatecancerukia]
MSDQCFVYCLDCRQFYTGTCDEKGIYQRDLDAEHRGHSVHVFGDPYTYQEPICSTLITLMRGGEVPKLLVTFTHAAIKLGYLDDALRISREEGIQAQKARARAAESSRFARRYRHGV